MGGRRDSVLCGMMQSARRGDVFSLMALGGVMHASMVVRGKRHLDADQVAVLTIH